MEKANKNKQLKVLLVNGSPHHCGNTFTALSEVAKTLEEKDIKTEIVHIGNRPVQGCIACYKCREKSFCVFQDEIYLTLREKLAKANGIIIGSPVYFGGPSGSLCALLDRLNKYFTILNMPVVPSQYWNCVHGRNPGEALQDAEGLQTMRTLARNMAWMLRNLCDSTHPSETEERLHTNFIR